MTHIHTAAGTRGGRCLGRHAQAQREGGGGPRGRWAEVVLLAGGVLGTGGVGKWWCVEEGCFAVQHPPDLVDCLLNFFMYTIPFQRFYMQARRGLPGAGPAVFHSYVRARYKGAIRCVSVLF